MDFIYEALQWLLLIWLVFSVRNLARTVNAAVSTLHRRLMRIEQREK